MNILVTGASGFLGKTLCRRLEGRGDTVTRLSTTEGDLRSAATLERYRTSAYDRIYHLAAWTRAGDFCLHHQGEQWLVNQQINTNVLNWWSEYQREATLIAIGTSCAYSPELPLSEDNYLRGMPTDDLFSYAMTKRMLHVGLLSLHKQFGLAYLTLVPATLYGPGYHSDGRQMHFIFDLITKIVRGRLFGEPVTLWGDGLQKRELLFVDDFVAALLRLPEIRSADIFNVGAGMEYTIREFALRICNEVGYDIEDVEFDPKRYVGVRSKCLDSSKLRRVVPDLQLTSLDDGLKATIDWVRTSISGAR